MSTQTVFLHQAIAQTIGLSATDTKCIDLILRAPGGTLTAGQLSQMSGLTSGAITHILDRLERRHFVERVRDTTDRRKVYIRVRPQSLAPVIPQYEAIGQAHLDLMEQYSDADLRLICGYLEKTSAVSERELAKLVAARDPRRTRSLNSAITRSRYRPELTGLFPEQGSKKNPMDVKDGIRKYIRKRHARG